MPFNNLTANTTWVALVCWAHNLVRVSSRAN